MKVIVDGSVFEVNEKIYRSCLKVGSIAVTCGIYAIEKDGLCEMRKDKFDNLKKMRKQVGEYTAKGFKVYYNWKG